MPSGAGMALGPVLHIVGLLLGLVAVSMAVPALWI